MLATLSLFALIAILIVLAKVMYPGLRKEESGPPLPDPREDRLATMLPEDLMTSLEKRSRLENRPLLDLVESLIRVGLEERLAENPSGESG